MPEKKKGTGPSNKEPGKGTESKSSSKQEKVVQLASLLAGVVAATHQTQKGSVSSKIIEGMDRITGNKLGFPDFSSSVYSDTFPSITHPELLGELQSTEEVINKARLRTANAIHNFNSTAQKLTAENSTRNLSDQEKVETLAPLIREMQSASLNEFRCAINLLEVVDASGTQTEQSFYKSSKDFMLALLDSIPVGGTNGATVSFRQFSVYGRTAQPGWTTDLSAIKNGIIGLNYQGGGTLANTGINSVIQDINTAQITPTAEKPLVIILRTDGKIQDEAAFAQGIANIRAATNGNVKFIVTYVEGQNEPVYGSIDTQTITKYLLPTDMIFSFFEPGAVIKALEAMNDIVRAACGTPPTSSPAAPITTEAPSTNAPSGVPTVSPSKPNPGSGLDPALAALVCINILLCIPLIRPRVKVGPREQDEPEAAEQPEAGRREPGRFDVADPGGAPYNVEGPVEQIKPKDEQGGYENYQGGATSSTMGIKAWRTVRTQIPDPGESQYIPPVAPPRKKDETWSDVWKRTSFELKASWGPIILAGLVTEAIYQGAKQAGLVSTKFDDTHLGTASKYLEPDLVKLAKMIIACCYPAKDNNPEETEESNSGSDSNPNPEALSSGNPLFNIMQAEARAALATPPKRPTVSGT